MEIGKLIAESRDIRDIKMVDLAKRANISVSYLNDIEKGRSTPTIETLKNIAKALNKRTSYFIDEETLLSIPILGTIRAGLPLLAEDNFSGEVEVPAGLKADFALRVTGDSMSWAGIHSGDLAILKQTNSPSHGVIVAAGIEDTTWEATLKFYVIENGRKLLRAANPEYGDIDITDRHRIIGQLVSIQKEPPSLQNYRELLVSKEIEDKQWQEAIEMARGYGLSGDKIKKMIELYASMFKQL